MSKRKASTVVIPVTVELSELELGGLDHDELFDFIVGLDLRVATYEFTERLRDHFVNEMKKEDQP